MKPLLKDEEHSKVRRRKCWKMQSRELSSIEIIGKKLLIFVGSSVDVIESEH